MPSKANLSAYPCQLASASALTRKTTVQLVAA